MAALAGSWVEVTLTKGDKVLTGLVVAYDEAAHSLILEAPIPEDPKVPEHVRHRKADYHIVQLEHVAKLALAAVESAATTTPLLAVHPVSVKTIEAIEGKNHEERRRYLASRGGPDVSPLGQRVSDALFKRQYPVFWEGTTLVVGDYGVSVEPPYAPSNCTGNPGAALDRIRSFVRPRSKP